MINAESLLVATGEGLGNRFVIADEETLRDAGVDPASLAPLACGDRYDGLLLRGADHRAAVINRDGSDGGTCLNGLRVLAMLDGADTGTLVMDGRAVAWRRQGSCVALTLRAEDLPQAARQPESCVVRGRDALAVQFWNPHCVIEVADPAAEDLAAWAHAARALTRTFPGGVNTELVRQLDASRVQMRVFERGVGETQACGSGAVAVALAAWSQGSRASLEVLMPGGSVHLHPLADGGMELVGEASVNTCK